MNILNKIIRDKRVEVDLRKKLIPQSQLEQSILFEKNSISLSCNLKQSNSGIIAEHKRRSPSKSIINQQLSVQEVAKGYQKAGACGMSVLTDIKYFGGAMEDLIMARASTEIPLLRKEFIVDEYQIIETKAYGGDVILLIAAILTPQEIKCFSELAQSLKLEVLLEVHNEKELQKSIIPSINMIGVNNRDLKTFEVSLAPSIRLSELIPDDFVKVSESGISTVGAIHTLKSYGYRGFLVGEHFMKTNNPGTSATQFIKDINA